MKVSKSVLEEAFQNAAKVIKPNVLPIYENALVECSPEGTVVTASSGSMFLRQHLKEVESQNAFSFCVPPKMVAETLSSLPEQEVVLKCNDENFALTISAVNGRYKINSENPADFSKKEIEGEASFHINSFQLRRLLIHTAFACSTDLLRPAMTGMLLKGNGKTITAAATDGYKLVEFNMDVELLKEPFKIIVPRQILNILLSLLPKEEASIAVYIENRHVGFAFGNMEISSVLIDERFPDYEGLISDEGTYTKKVSLKRMEILSSLNRLNLFTDNNKAVRFEFSQDGTVKLKAKNQLDFSAEEVLKGDECTIPEGHIGFSSRYLIEILRSLEGEFVTFAYEGPNKKAFIKDAANTNETALLMPCNIE